MPLDHCSRRYAALLQRLGQRSAHRLQPWLAAQADAFEDQQFFLANRGYGSIAHERRGHGRSSQPWHGNDLDTYADDLAALVEHPGITDAVHLGHSTGGGEVARHIARHGNKRVAKAVLISAFPPLMLKTPANPGGLPIEVFDPLPAADLLAFCKH